MFCEALQNANSLGLITENAGALISLTTTELDVKKEDEKKSEDGSH